ncbi:(Fe-S)-binding protein, partial [Chloroflexota bacterium]
MANKTELEEIKRFEKDLQLCMKCGFCTFWCPVYQEERVESSVARGKDMMIRALVAGDLEYTREFAERLDKCTLCMACTANCPARVQIPPVIVAARADKVKAKGVNFPYNVIFRWLLPRRRLFGSVVRLASWFQGLFLPRTRGTVRHLAFFLSALGKGRNIPQIAPKFLRQSVPVVNRPPVGVQTVITVGYFSGCMTDFVFPDVGQKVISFLTRNGVEVMVPREQGCCGAPVFLGAGDFETGRRFADTNVKAFADVDYVVTDCATCGSAMKDYLKFLADTPEREEAYAKFRDKVKDITEFLVDILKLPASAYHATPEVRGQKVTWHDPCHLARHMGIREQPRQILKSIPEIEYIEMPNADRCCGMAGTFSVYFYDLSQKIAEKKVASIDATGADIVVTDCPGCEIQLIDNTIRQETPVK